MGGTPADEPPSLEDARVVRARAAGLDRWPDAMRELEAGRGFAAHAKLLARRRIAAAERAALDRVLADPRLFVEPAKPPSLGRLNGLGTGMYGRASPDREDGTYVKTRCVSAFWIPILPLDRWLVQDADGGGWYFLGKVPSDRGTRSLRAAGLAALGLVASIVAFAIWWAGSHAEMHLLNGLDVPAELFVDDEPARLVHPGGRESFEISTGSHRMRCVVAGRTVDERTERVIDADLVVYNVAGSAPLYVEEIEYFQEGSGTRSDEKEREPGFELLAGRVFTHRSSVHYVLEDPPERISLSRGRQTEVRRHAAVAEGGWRASVGIAEEMGDAERAASVAEAVALAQIEDADVVAEAIEVSAASRTPEEHAKFVAKVNEARGR